MSGNGKETQEHRGRWIALAGFAGCIALLAFAGLAAAMGTDVPGGQFGTDVTWTAAGSPYRVHGQVFMQAEPGGPRPTLTVEPGVIVEADPGVVFLIGDASLHAVGTAEQPILFTSPPSLKAPGTWSDIRSSSPGSHLRLENVTVEYGGANGNGVLTDGDADAFVLKNCIVRHNGGTAVATIPAGGLLVEGCDIHHNAGHGIFFGAGSGFAIRANSVHDNGGIGIASQAGEGVVEGNVIARNAQGLRMSQSTRPLSNSFADNGVEIIDVVPGGVDVRGAPRWERNLDNGGRVIPYRILEQSLGVSGHLTLDPGVTVLFPPGANMIVAGGLEARGTAELPILFTSTQAQKAAGQWGTIQLWESSAGRVNLSHFVAEYGGAPGHHFITSGSQPVPMSDCIVRHSAGPAAIVVGGSIERCEIYGHAGDPVVALWPLHVSGSWIHDNGGVGVRAHAHGTIVEETTIERNGIAFYMHPDTTLAASTTFDGNVLSEIQVPAIDGPYGARTWSRFEDETTGEPLRYHILGSPNAASNLQLRAPLVIEAGNTIVFEEQDGIHVAVGASLEAAGTAEKPVVFTSIASSPAAADWRGIVVTTGSPTVGLVLRHAVVEYAGHPSIEPGAGAAINGFGALLDFEDCIVRHTTVAIQFWDSASGAVRIVDCAIYDNAVGLSTIASAPEITRNQIVDNELGLRSASSGGTIHDNVFRNVVNARDDTGSTTYAIPKTPAPSGTIIGGPYYGGNAWSDYPGRDCTGDGLGDTHLPYRTVGLGVDPRPLVPVEQDMVPPTSAHGLDGVEGNAGWWRSAVTVTLDASDDLCGVRAIFYALDGGAPTAYAGAFTIADDGVHELTYWAEDNAGAIEAAHAVTIPIDATAPTVALRDPVRGNVYVNDLGVPIHARGTCRDVGIDAACAEAASIMASDCDDVLPAAVCADLPFEGVLPLTVLIGNKTLEADATDATSGVRIVDFLVDGRSLGTDATAPYKSSYDTSREAFRRHAIVVVVEDEAGNVATSEPERPIVVPLEIMLLCEGAHALAPEAPLTCALLSEARVVLPETRALLPEARMAIAPTRRASAPMPS